MSAAITDAAHLKALADLDKLAADMEAIDLQAETLLAPLTHAADADVSRMADRIYGRIRGLTEPEDGSVSIYDLRAQVSRVFAEAERKAEGLA